MLQQSELAAKQYENTLQQLAQVNSTVHSLVDIISNTRTTFEEKLNWLADSLGGTGSKFTFFPKYLLHKGNRISFK